MTSEHLANFVVALGCVVAAAPLLMPRLARSRDWRATVTPLASIIGSGFLVLAPLLVREFGHHAGAAMAALCVLAYAVGGGIRSNIEMRARHVGGRTVERLEHASAWALSFAYVISVAYYLNLFGAFAVSLTPWHQPWHGKAVTSAVLLLIAGLGWRGGLHALERAETLTVGIKLAIIGGLLAGMAWYVAGHGMETGGAGSSGHWGLSALPMFFGLLITVQGFETSRYLGAEYDVATRVRTMRRAQWLSSAIYVAYIGLTSICFTARDVPLSETAVIGMMAPVAALLPPLLVLAALAAQFSAAVADTNGCGGLVGEMSRGRLSPRQAYVALVAAALLLTWVADIFQIISLASRAFAVYYAMQMALAFVMGRETGAPRWRRAWHGALMLLMLVVVAFGQPAE